MLDLSDELLFAALARVAEWRIGKFNVQALAKMAWAFVRDDGSVG